MDPTWIAGVSAVLCCYAQRRVCIPSAMQVRRVLRGAGMFVDADTTDRKMQKKVREAQLSQYNYILVIGEQERVSDCLGHGRSSNMTRLYKFHSLASYGQG